MEFHRKIMSLSESQNKLPVFIKKYIHYIILLVLVFSFSACGDSQVTVILSDTRAVISHLIILSIFGTKK